MKVLLDTHIFIWWNGNLKRLPPSARALCEDPSNTTVLSLASIWEMQVKHQLGKLTLANALPEIIASQQQDNGLELLPITAEHIYALDRLPAHHRDPFDRMLIAQAQVEQIVLVTADAAFTPYGISICH